MAQQPSLRRPGARRSRASVAAAGLLLAALGAAGGAFVPGPARRQPAAAAVAATGAALAPLAAHAELPPLEDLPLEGLKGNVKDLPMSIPDTFVVPLINIELPILVLGIPFFILPPLCAVAWAAFWVTNLEPTRGNYKTYLGAGSLPPQGYTNPLDPRLKTETLDDDDEPALDKYRKSADKKKKGSKSAKSAIV